MKRLPILFLLSLAAVGFGCSGSAPDRPQTVPATGKVTYNDKPVEGATVTFVPQEGKHAAVGVTDASGEFSLMTFAAGDGAIPGRYQVKVAKFETAQQSPPAESSSALSEDQMPSFSSDYQPPAPKNLLPLQYADTGSSGLSATVGESPEENVFELSLTD